MKVESDAGLERAKEEVSRRHDSAARGHLRQFIMQFDEQIKRQGLDREQWNRDAERSYREHSRFISDSAYDLLKPNAEFILSKIPERKDTDDGGHDRKEHSGDHLP
jgi:hypothetical protein